MFGQQKENEVAVLYQITNLSSLGYSYFKLDSPEYSLFSYEQEVLFVNGTFFHIEHISEEILNDKKYYLVQLKFHDEYQVLLD